MFLATDNADEAREGLGINNIVTLADLGLSIEPGMEQVYDFAGLSAADVLVSSRSTFSRVSTLFNKNNPEVWYSAQDDMPFERSSAVRL